MTTHDPKLEGSFHMLLLGFCIPFGSLSESYRQMWKYVRQVISFVWLSLPSSIDHPTKSGFCVRVKARIEVYSSPVLWE